LGFQYNSYQAASLTREAVLDTIFPSGRLYFTLAGSGKYLSQDLERRKMEIIISFTVKGLARK
jgi:hypothetical protein